MALNKWPRGLVRSNRDGLGRIRPNIPDIIAVLLSDPKRNWLAAREGLSRQNIIFCNMLQNMHLKLNQKYIFFKLCKNFTHVVIQN
jgi:hypothetical protein